MKKITKISSTNYIKRNLYECKDTLKRLKIVTVYVSGKVIARTKEGTTIETTIGNLRRVY